METNQALVKAAQAIWVALSTNASQGGDLSKKLHEANPMCVNALYEALQNSGQLPA